MYSCPVLIFGQCGRHVVAAKHLDLITSAHSLSTGDGKLPDVVRLDLFKLHMLLNDFHVKHKRFICLFHRVSKITTYLNTPCVVFDWWPKIDLLKRNTPVNNKVLILVPTTGRLPDSLDLSNGKTNARVIPSSKHGTTVISFAWLNKPEVFSVYFLCFCLI